ncbi:MAG TPA: hypothetical protein VH414_00500 [Lichenihabitans sp.]|jgi:hypothetical protein|nr:hypothetical protein [Lichenihabitans sp.]
MAFRRGGFALNAPKVITFAISIVLVVVALVSTQMHLPVGASFVVQHRLGLVVAGYVLLALGCLLPGL